MNKLYHSRIFESSDIFRQIAEMWNLNKPGRLTQTEGRFIGNPTLRNSGELYEQAVAMSTKNGLPKPLAVVVIHISEIHSLKPGPMAGKKIS